MANNLLHQCSKLFKPMFEFLEEIFSASIICRFKDRKDLELFNELYINDEPTETFSIWKVVAIIFKGVALFILVAIIPYIIIFSFN